MSGINKGILKEIGLKIRARREELSYSQKDVSNMTGLTVNMISTFENGKGSTLNNFLLICRALQIQPKDVLVDDIDLRPLYDLPPESRRRLEITQKLDDLVYNSDFFKQPKRVAEVIKELDSDKRDSNKFSVYLTSYCKEGELEYVKEGNIKKYRRP
ncbi:helix-turn-helix domain-containing protein [Sphingobacterium deserti]|uniref:Lambda repressor-like DNA-binding protein n=1 Tax=Sphingobacterium deserti TaxID=1229276 RepID=A0A0B8T9C3_9SPHI|nr:helix-turn-helix domain-containing protein [Sphingobacterium deserti]KGE15319.1 lambda repressor-like DNA-binding protein [Sphingobacterium deserti]